MRTVLLMGLVGCAAQNVRDVLGMTPDLAGNRVGVLEPRWLGDLAPPADDMEAFRDGTWAGTIWFGGGFEVLPEEDNQVRSVSVELNDAELYREQASAWAGEALRDAATSAGWQVVPTKAPDLSIGAPTRRAIRGTVEHDGDDNVNLPRFDLTAAPLELSEPIPGVDAVLVPVMVQYYAHNSGWFVGQAGGTWAGARVRLLWSLHDASSGAILGWGDVGTKAEIERLASPNRQELQDLLLDAEAEAAKRLTRQLCGKGGR